jgi:hypothetical protein
VGIPAPLSATAPLPSTPSQLLQAADGEGDGRHHRTLPSEAVSVIRSKGMYRGESMDSASDAGRRRAASEEAGTSTGEEEDEEAVRVSRTVISEVMQVIIGWSTDLSSRCVMAAVACGLGGQPDGDRRGEAGGTRVVRPGLGRPQPPAVTRR